MSDDKGNGWDKWGAHVLSKLDELSESMESIRKNIVEIRQWMAAQDQRWSDRIRVNGEFHEHVKAVEAKLDSLESNVISLSEAQKVLNHQRQFNLNRTSVIIGAVVALMAFGSMVTSILSLLIH